MNSEIIIFSIAAVVLVGFSFFAYWQGITAKKEVQIHQKEINRKIYELAILKELGDRIGYSLNVQQIIDIITGSLHQLIEYVAVSYMIIEPEKIVFKVHLETSVDRQFLNDIKERMLKSLAALLDKNISGDMVDEVVTGAIMIEDLKSPVESFFNIPIAIAGKVEGILTIAHTRPGLYKEADMTILYRIMQQASSAVERLEDVVKNEQRKLNAMVQSISEGVVMVDTDYRITVSNKAIRVFIGLGDKPDLTIFDLIEHLGGRFDIRGKLEESIKLNKIIETPEVLIGDKFFQIIIAPVKSKSSINTEEVIGGVVIFHDITHDKEVDKLREDFTSMMVHELRSPLDGIKKRMEVAREEGINYTKEQIEEINRSIYQNASHMLELVNDLLDAAKLEAGKFQFRKEFSDIRTLIKDRISFFEVLARDGNMKMEYHFDDSIPEKVNLDPMRIEQVLNNLISNSLKFTESGGKVRIDAFLHKSGADIASEIKNSGAQWIDGPGIGLPVNLPDSLVVSVSDTGVGMSKTDLSELFNKFKQFRSTAVRKEKTGTGLGLAISKGIVEGQGGFIGVASAEGSGTTFFFTIPIS